ncbi:MAG: hypothetical protein ABIP05_01350, partial [Nitrospiraceae bacterium]
SANPQPVRTNIPIEANGHYSVDVTGLTAPFAFLATGTVGGKTVSLYAAATSADVGGTINITPFTDLIIRNIAAGAVDAYINNRTFTGLTPAQLDAQRVALTNQLAPALVAMGLSGSIDLLRAVFNADSTGLDRFMDVVKVSPTPTGATITNILDAANQLILDTAGASTSPALGTGGLATSGTPADLILQTFNNVASLFVVGLPNPADPNLVALFSSTFLDGGDNRSSILTDITTNPFLIGLKFSNLVVDSVDIAAGTAQVHVTPQDAAGQCVARDLVSCSLSWQMVKNGGGVWQIAGDQRLAQVRVRTEARHCSAGSSNCPTADTYESGLGLTIKNNGLLPIGSAVVKGPALPAQGVTLTAQPNSTEFAFPSPSCQGCTTNMFTMTDLQIASLSPNGNYTVELFSNASVPALMAAYTEVVPVPPVLNRVLPTLAFPSITSTQNLAGITTATLTPSWNIPPGLWGDVISVNMNQPGPTPGSGATLNVLADLHNSTATSGTSTLVITAPPAGSWAKGAYFIHAWDQYGGEVSTDYH